MKITSPKRVKLKWDWSKQDKLEAEMREKAKKKFNYLSPKQLLDKESLKSSVTKDKDKKFAQPIKPDKDYLSVFRQKSKGKVIKYADSPKVDRDSFKRT